MDVLDKEGLKKYPSINRVLQAFSAKRGGLPSLSTEKSFLLYMVRYCRFYTFRKLYPNANPYDFQRIERKLAQMKLYTPEEILEERRIQQTSPDDSIKFQHEDLVKLFVNVLRNDKQCSSGKVANTVIAVKAFYRENYRPLLVKQPAIVPVRDYKVPTPSELFEIVKRADLLMATWIICAKDSGMSPIDLVNLTGNENHPTYGTIKQQLRKGRCPIFVNVIRQKTLAKGLGFYTTFFGEEAIQALLEYLPRKRVRKRIFEITECGLGHKFNRFCRAYGWIGFVPKSCRKFFNGRMKLFAGVNETVVEFMMGHSIRQEKAAYIRETIKNNPDFLAEIYLRAYDHLRIFPKDVNIREFLREKWVNG